MRPRTLVAGLFAALLLVGAIVVAFPPTAPQDLAAGDDSGAEVGNGSGNRPVNDASNGSSTVQVVGGDLGVDQTALWGWTQDALGREGNFTPAVVIRDVASPQTTVQTDAEAFQRRMVYDDPDDPPPGGVLAYVTSLSPNVTVNADRLPAIRNGSSWRSVEGMLVHEFTHVLQYQTPAFAANQLVPIDTTTDELTAYTAMVEGGAEFVANDYTETDSEAELRGQWTDSGTPAPLRLSYWPYYRGLGYLEDRLAEPRELWDVYDPRPPTTAAILRGEVPGDGPPERESTLAREDYRTDVKDRLGAAFAEVTLTKAIAPDRARSVAADWRWDQLRSVRAEPGTVRDRSLQHVWLTEWRGPDAAADFEAAMTEYLDARFEREDGAWAGEDGTHYDLRRVDEASLALLVGSESFLAGSAVSLEDDEYVIADAPDATASVDARAVAVP